MPYIKQCLRRDVDDQINSLIEFTHHLDEVYVDGVVNYVITRLLNGVYVDDRGESYGNYTRAIGTLSMIMLETYRRMCVPYENMKRDENGEVFNP